MPDRRWDLVVLGELNPDVLLDAPSASVPFGQTETELAGASLVLGSSGAITAAAAASAGLRVAMCAVVGADHLGALATDLLDRAGVDVSAVHTRPELATGLTVVVNAPGGDRAMLTHTGAMAELRRADVPPSLLTDARHVHVSSVFLQRALLPELPGLFADLRADGVSTSLDPGWDPREEWAGVAECLPRTSYLFPNEAELRALAGVDDVTAAARALAERGPTVAVKLGARGGLVAGGRRGVRLDGTPVEPVDTTGAGDNFDAGFLYGVTRGLPVEECLAAAVAAGRLAVQGRGGTGRLATAAELDHAVAADGPRVRRLWGSDD